MKRIKSKNDTKVKKLLCDWTNEKKNLIHYRMLTFHVRHGNVVEKFHGKLSIKQSEWLEKFITFNTQKRKKAENDIEKAFYKSLNNAFHGKTMEIVRHRLRLELLKKDDSERNIKQQSKLNFNGFRKSYENCDSYTFKQKEVLMYKPISLGFARLGRSKLHMYETNYDILQHYSEQENIQLGYMDCDSFVLSLKTKIVFKDLKNLEDIFDFSNLDEDHEKFINENKKLICKFKIETPINNWIDDFFALRSEMFACKCGADSKNKMKCICKPHSKNFKSEDFKKCLDGEKYQSECNNFFLQSIDHDMYLQEYKKLIISLFGNKRCNTSNSESKPWNHQKLLTSHSSIQNKFFHKSSFQLFYSC